MKVRFFIILTTILSWTYTAQAQSFHISGKVTDNTDRPLSKATIYLSETQDQSSAIKPVEYQARTTTGANRNYLFSDISQGNY